MQNHGSRHRLADLRWSPGPLLLPRGGHTSRSKSSAVMPACRRWDASFRGDFSMIGDDDGPTILMAELDVAASA